MTLGLSLKQASYFSRLKYSNEGNNIKYSGIENDMLMELKNYHNTQHHNF